MVSKLSVFTVMLLLIQSSTSSPIEDEKLVELTKRLERLQAKIEADDEKWTSKFEDLQAQNSKQREEIVLLKNLLESSNLPSKSAKQLKDKDNNSPFMTSSTPPSVIATLPTTTFLPTPTTFPPTPTLLPTPALSPTSCQDLVNTNVLVPMNATYLLKNNNRIQVVYCKFKFGNPVTVIQQQSIGNVDVKTKIVHFYVQRVSRLVSSSTKSSVIPFEVSRLNEGGAMNLTSGVFTAPVDGIYHFQFSGLKDKSTASSKTLSIYLQLNGVNVGQAYGEENTDTGSYSTVSLSSSLRLKAGDRVNLNKDVGTLVSSDQLPNHFVGWLVEEDLN